MVALFFAAQLMGASAVLPQTEPSRRAFSLYDEFNREAAASDPKGIEQYTSDLIRLLAPPGSNEPYTKAFDPLVRRLTQAEEAARSNKGKLVAVIDIVRAFNDLMVKIGAPPSMRTSEASIRSFREHAAEIKAFPALFTQDRNGANCNPGEAVFLIYLLLSDNGSLYEKNLDSAQAITRWNGQSNGRGFATFSVESVNANAMGLLSSYDSSHSTHATTQLLAGLTRTLGF